MEGRGWVWRGEEPHRARRRRLFVGAGKPAGPGCHLQVRRCHGLLGGLRTETMTSDLNGTDVTTPAVVLKFDPNVMHHGGLGAIRSLGRLGVPAYGVHAGPWAPAANSRYLQARLLRPPPGHRSVPIHTRLLQPAHRI